MAVSLTNQTIIVTGAGSGFGESMSYALAGQGVNIIAADIDQERAKSVACRIRDENGRARPMKVDVSDKDEVSQMVKSVIWEYGSIDVLINNAGIAGPMGELQTISVEEWDRVFSVNVRGPFLCCREALPHMIEKGRGHIVNISSSTARIGFKDVRSLPYTCSKLTIEGFSYWLACSVEPHGIRVNALCPSLSVTRFQKETAPEHLRGKRCWTPDHVTGPLLHLLTEMEGTGKSVMASDWHKERGSADKFSYTHD